MVATPTFHNDTDLSTLTVSELQSLKTLLETEIANSKAKIAHLQGLVTKVDSEIAGRP